MHYRVNYWYTVPRVFVCTDSKSMYSHAMHSLLTLSTRLLPYLASTVYSFVNMSNSWIGQSNLHGWQALCNVAFVAFCAGSCEGGLMTACSFFSYGTTGFSFDTLFLRRAVQTLMDLGKLQRRNSWRASHCIHWLMFTIIPVVNWKITVSVWSRSYLNWPLQI